MLTLLVIIVSIICLILVLLVLIQNTKGGGLVSNMSGASQIMGVKRTMDWIEKATWGFGIALFIMCVIFTGFIKNDSPQDISPNIEGVEQKDTSNNTTEEAIVPEDDNSSTDSTASDN